jgi:hypothetical protein
MLLGAGRCVTMTAMWKRRQRIRRGLPMARENGEEKRSSTKMARRIARDEEEALTNGEDMSVPCPTDTEAALWVC